MGWSATRPSPPTWLRAGRSGICASIPLAEAELGKSVKHDVSIPISAIAGFVDKTNALLQARFPGVRHVIFGHLGDGNLHYNVANAAGQTEAELLALQGEIYGVVHDSVHAHAAPSAPSMGWDSSSATNCRATRARSNLG